MNDGTDEEGKLILALDVGGTKIAGSVLRFSSGHMPELIRLVQEPTQAQEADWPCCSGSSSSPASCWDESTGK